ncbi:MAG: hypothetical protein VX278_17355, partial [Myxococcota bacterium]|nr:hypothetical protein [Myxococcota bacterium]
MSRSRFEKYEKKIAELEEKIKAFEAERSKLRQRIYELGGDPDAVEEEDWTALASDSPKNEMI